MRDRSLLHAQHAYDNAEPDEGAPLVIDPASLRCRDLERFLADRGVVRLTVTSTRGYFAACAETGTSDGDGWSRDLGEAIAVAVSEAIARAEAA